MSLIINVFDLDNKILKKCIFDFEFWYIWSFGLYLFFLWANSKKERKMIPKITFNNGI
ncbi:Uncharacterised protein [Capnocytophaga canimorsus]|nr:hypothetical protein CLV61_1105 [Capnocytophaga canimorsus]STA73260.1 Uncharacterised protein [Capnocytophaga canimorsus]